MIERGSVAEIESFIARISIRGQCWIWMGSRGPTGYGTYTWRDEGGGMRGTPAHRRSYELFAGPIPMGLELDHLCSIRACVRPSHLEPVTHLENVWRAVANRRVGSSLVAERRTALGMTIEELTRLAMLSNKTIVEVEAGRVNPRRRTRYALAVALDMDEQDLFPDAVPTGLAAS